MKIFFFSILLQVISIFSNTRLPVIAIVGMPLNSDHLASRVKANYIRWLQASGADAVVIQPWYTPSQVNEILSKVNGVLIQGGDIRLKKEIEYYNTVKHIVTRVKEIKDNQNIEIPVLGVCHGFHTLTIVIADNFDILVDHEVENTPTNLIFNKTEIQTSRLYSHLTDEDFNNLLSKPTTAQFHRYGFSVDSFTSNAKLKSFYKVTANARDMKGKFYVASIEAYGYPIYGVQYHPEMIAFEASAKKNVPNTSEAIRISRFIGNFYVNEARNGNTNMMPLEDLPRYDFIDPYEKYPEWYEDSYQYLFHKKE